jgi:peptidoglycan/xylan/chitin deacetylase (PgdA/CDA1 family)
MKQKAERSDKLSKRVLPVSEQAGARRSKSTDPRSYPNQNSRYHERYHEPQPSQPQPSLSRRGFLGFLGFAGVALTAGSFFLFGPYRLLDRLAMLFDPERRPGLVDGVPWFDPSYLLDSQQPRYRFELRLDSKRLLFGEIGQSLGLSVAEGPDFHLLEEADYASSDEAVATVDSFGTVTAQGYGTCLVTVGFGPHSDTCQVTVAEKWAAITFDDGPCDATRRLLTGLRERQTVATFFVLGNMALGREDILREADADGHEIANHSYNHQGGASVLADQLYRTDNIIEAAIGRRTNLMRPPGGAVNSATYSCGKPIINWDVDPRDWEVREVETVYKNIMNATGSGSIILLHDLYESTVDAAFKAIDSLHEQGYVFVTVSDLLGDPQPGVLYRYGPQTPRNIKFIR